MSVLRSFTLVIILLSLTITLCAQPLSMKGQFWGGGFFNHGTSFESIIGYIPTLSLYKELDSMQLLDLELSYRLDYMYSGDSLIYNKEHFHRYWIRYSSNKLEARLGLQKIVFGPSQRLRPLSWFDTIDLKDPTNQTEGVEAMRICWFPSNSATFWFWSIMNDQNKFSYGGRGELSTNFGGWGFSYHSNPSANIQDDRIAIDYRHDGVIGFWNESAIIKSNESREIMVTIGGDYTLSIANGILIMTESMYISSKNNASSSPNIVSTFISSLPIGVFHHFMVISDLDWRKNKNYNYLRWSTAYDSFSINCMVSINPMEIGNSFQLMLIYNH